MLQTTFESSEYSEDYDFEQINNMINFGPISTIPESTFSFNTTKVLPPSSSYPGIVMMQSNQFMLEDIVENGYYNIINYTNDDWWDYRLDVELQVSNVRSQDCEEEFKEVLGMMRGHNILDGHSILILFDSKDQLRSAMYHLASHLMLTFGLSVKCCLEYLGRIVKVKDNIID